MTPNSMIAENLRETIAYLKRETDAAYERGDIHAFEEIWEDITDAQDELRDLGLEIEYNLN